MSRKVKLLPCPRCGCKPKWRKDWHSGARCYMNRLNCCDVHAIAPSKFMASAVWNDVVTREARKK